MARPVVVDEKVKSLLSDGRLVTHSDLLSMGMSRASITRLVSRGVLMRGVRDMYVLADKWVGDPLQLLAKRFGGEEDAPQGVLCLQVAAHIHSLTDMDFHNIKDLEVALPAGNTATVPKSVRAKIVHWKQEYLLGHVEWHQFGQHGIHVTTPERTVCDLYHPTLGASRSTAKEALGRLMVEDRLRAKAAVEIATSLHWGKQITEDYESMRVLQRFTQLETNDSSLEGVTL